MEFKYALLIENSHSFDYYEARFCKKKKKTEQDTMLPIYVPPDKLRYITIYTRRGGEGTHFCNEYKKLRNEFKYVSSPCVIYTCSHNIIPREHFLF